MTIRKLKNMPVLIFLCTVSFSIVMLLDFWLPAKHSTQIVTGTKTYKQLYRTGGRMVYGIKTNMEEIPVAASTYSRAGTGDTIEVIETSVFKAVKRVEVGGYTDSSLFSIYNGYCLFPTILLIISLVGLLLKYLENDSFQHCLVVSVAISSYLVIGMFTNHII